MAKGKKTGGRQKGSRNHRTEAQAAAIENSGLTPLDYMLTVLRDPAQEYDVRLDAAKAAAPYVHPKLANIELTGKDKGPLEVNVLRYSSEQLAPSPVSTQGVASARTGSPPRSLAVAPKVGQG